MIISEKRTGWADHKLIRCLHSWSDSFRNSGTIKFFNGDAQYVTEIYIEDTNLVWTVFPHTPDIIVHVMEHEQALRKIFKENHEKGLGDRALVYLKDGVRAVTIADFTKYYPEADYKDELFIFSGASFETGGFPKVYYYGKDHRKMKPHILPMLCEASTTLMSCISSPTALGKKFAHTMLLSRRASEITYPDMKSVDLNFPTTGLKFAPSGLLSTKEFDKFVESCPNNLTVGTQGMSYNDIPVDEPDDTENEEKAQAQVEVYGKPPRQELERIVEKSAIVIGQVNLSDIFEIGIGRAIAMLPITNEIIDIIPDMPGIARKMCIYEGLIHMIPMDQEFDPEKVLGEPDEFFNICIDEATYPKKVAQKPYIN